MKKIQLFSMLPFLVALIFPQQDFAPLKRMSAKAQTTSMLTNSPWKQIGFEVSPAIEVEEGFFVEDLFDYVEDHEKRSIFHFSADGEYSVYLSNYFSYDETEEMFAASSSTKANNNTTTETQQPMAFGDLAEPELVLLETGNWKLNVTGRKLTKSSNDGQLKAIDFKIAQISPESMVIQYKKVIQGEVHQFTQTFAAQNHLEVRY